MALERHGGPGERCRQVLADAVDELTGVAIEDSFQVVRAQAGLVGPVQEGADRLVSHVGAAQRAAAGRKAPRIVTLRDEQVETVDTHYLTVYSAIGQIGSVQDAPRIEVLKQKLEHDAVLNERRIE